MGACLCRSSPSNSRKHSEDSAVEINNRGTVDKKLEVASESPRNSEAEKLSNETVEEVFIRFSKGKNELSDDDGGKISEFFAQLGCPLDRADGFAAFCLLKAEQFSTVRFQEVQQYCSSHSVSLFRDLRQSFTTESKSLYSSARALHSFFEYIFLTSKSFLYSFKDSLHDYQLDDAWPTLFDDFVRARERRDRV